MNEARKEQMIKAVSHRIRREVMKVLLTIPDALAPTELAEELRMPLSRLAYHVTVLEDLGLIDLVDTEARRGAVKHLYRPSALTEDPFVRVLLFIES